MPKTGLGAKGLDYLDERRKLSKQRIPRKQSKQDKPRKRRETDRPPLFRLAVNGGQFKRATFYLSIPLLERVEAYRLAQVVKRGGASVSPSEIAGEALEAYLSRRKA